MTLKTPDSRFALILTSFKRKIFQIKLYPQAERPVLRKAILYKYPKINVRTLDRHLEKAFKESQSESGKKEMPLVVTEIHASDDIEIKLSKVISNLEDYARSIGGFSDDTWDKINKETNAKSKLKKAIELMEFYGLYADNEWGTTVNSTCPF